MVYGELLVAGELLCALCELPVLLCGNTLQKIASSQISFCSLPTDDPRQRQPDITKARAKLGWEPTIPLEQGLVHTIAYFDRLLSRGNA